MKDILILLFGVTGMITWVVIIWNIVLLYLPKKENGKIQIYQEKEETIEMWCDECNHETEQVYRGYCFNQYRVCCKCGETN